MTPERITLPPLVLDLSVPKPVQPAATAPFTDVTPEALKALGWSDSAAAELYEINLQLRSKKA